jgi:D-alanyl-D-alanine carboxypeptidase
MYLVAMTRRLNCRPFTQHVLELKALLEWKSEQAKKEKGKEKGKEKERESIMEEEKDKEGEKEDQEDSLQIEERNDDESKITIPEIHINGSPPEPTADPPSPPNAPVTGLTPSEWSIYIEFANTQRLHTTWPVALMDAKAGSVGLSVTRSRRRC